MSRDYNQMYNNNNNKRRQDYRDFRREEVKVEETPEVVDEVTDEVDAVIEEVESIEEAPAEEEINEEQKEVEELIEEIKKEEPVVEKVELPNTDKGRVIGSGNLNVRKAPIMGDNVASFLAPGTFIKIEETVGEWYKISEPICGFVKSKFVEV